MRRNTDLEEGLALIALLAMTFLLGAVVGAIVTNGGF